MKLRLSLLSVLGGAFTLATLQASGVLTYSDWESFLSEGITAVFGDSTASCVFTATGDVRMGGSWTQSSTLDVSGTVVMDGNGYAMNGNSQTFGGYNVSYAGDLVVTNWSSWNNCVQNGGVSTTERNTTLFTVTTGSMTVSNTTFENNYFHPDLGAVVTGGLIRSSSTGSTSPSGSQYGLYITDSEFIGNTTTAPDSTSNTNASGLVICNSGTALIENSTFSDNAITVTFTNADRCSGAAIRNDDGGTMELNTVTFTGNKAMYGGAIYNAGADATSSVAGSSITMTNCYFEGNGTPYSTSSSNAPGGGAIYTDGYGTSLTIENTQFIENQGSNGGAIMDATSGTSTYRDTYTIKNSTFSGNLAVYGSGGAIYGMGYAKWVADNNTYTGNIAQAGHGGALYFSGSSYVQAAFTNSTFDSNEAQAGYGGAAYFKGSYHTVDFTGSTFEKNTATKGAGAVYFTTTSVTATFDDAKFISNSSKSGGAVYITDASAKACFNRAEFTTNVADGSGGALYIYGKSAVLQAENAAFTGNSSTSGGGAIYLSGSSASVDLDGATFTGNETTGSGGAVYLSGTSATASFDGTTFTDNHATTYTTAKGGAVYLNGNTATAHFANATFSGNTAIESGGAVYAMGTSVKLSIVDSDFINNSTDGSGAALLIYKGQAVIAAANKDVTFSGNTSGDGTGAVHLYDPYSAGTTVYLNAAEGKSITFAGDGLSGTGNSVNTVYINHTGVDSDAITADTQAAGTKGTIAFTRNADTGAGSTIANVTLDVAGGALSMDATALEYTLVEAMSSSLSLTDVQLRNSSAFTLGDDAAATVSGMSLSQDATAVAFTLNSATASLSLKGKLTIALDSYYSSVSEIALDDSFSYQLVTLGEGASFSLDNLSVAFTYDGAEMAYEGSIDMQELLTSGAITFAAAASGDAVPEPTTATLSLLALTLLAARRRRV